MTLLLYVGKGANYELLLVSQVMSCPMSDKVLDALVYWGDVRLNALIWWFMKFTT